MSTSRDYAKTAGRLLETVREMRPLVQCVTNFVSMDVTANVLLALGASPAMVHAPEESAEFIGRADALTCNIGTLSVEWLSSMRQVAEIASEHGRPWVLDPVGVGGTSFRDRATDSLLAYQPTVIRGNASEIIAIARNAKLTERRSLAKGVDGLDVAEDLLSSALARKYSCVVAATGETDVVADGRRLARLNNGSPLMTRVTALGCALSAVVAAFLAVSEDPYEATVSALAVYSVAGEKAAKSAERPGSFRVAFIDALNAITAEDLTDNARIS